jgi:hypothetical protein
VLCTPAGVDLTRRAYPDDLPGSARFDAVALHPDFELSLPSIASFRPADETLSDEEARALRDLEDDAGDSPDHRLLGHERPVQHGHIQARLCQLAANGIEPYGTASDSDEIRGLEAAAVDWVLLAQFDSDDAAGMQWGDVGRLYYWIRRGDLAARRFDDVWVIAQSH